MPPHNITITGAAMLWDVITGLRVSEKEEQQGLDIVSHEEKGYDL